MAYSLRYWGEFSSIQGVLYRVEVWQNSDTAFIPSEVGFAYDEPAEIEWNETDKLDPVQGSCLTLTLDSDSDRKFLDLYTIDVDSVRADIYRDGLLYWSGMLDPELYEEPFSYKQGYDVTITFSDFAILDRKKWEGREIYTVQQIIDKCLAATGICYSGQTKYISTQLSAAEAGDLLTDCSILGENFYDEDDEPMTLREVLEETLRPFALRVVQKNGQIHIYDLNALYGQSAHIVEWSDVDATIGADKVYNNIKITFSPYASSTLVDGSLDPDDVANHTEGLFFDEMINTDRKSGVDGFTIHFGNQSKDSDPVTLKNGAYLFHIDPEYSGNKEAGIMWGYKPDDDWRGNYVRNAFEDNANVWPSEYRCKEIIKLPRRHILVDDMAQYRLRITLEVLFDVRYNPFESASGDNSKGNWDKLNNWVNYGYIPFQLLAYDAHGVLKYYYSNDEIRQTSSYAKKGSWKVVTDNATPQKMVSWLCFYDTSDRKSKTGFGGWQKNKKMIGQYAGGFPSAFKADIDGELCVMPPISGFLELNIFSGIWCVDNDNSSPYKDIYSISRWLLYKNPIVSIAKSNGREIDAKDVTVTAWINRQAKESLDISTIVGTSEKVVPSGRGYVLRSGDLEVLRTFYRGGVADSLERLLAGTVYSQYASRNHILSGTVEAIPTFGVLTDRAEPGQYMLLSEVQHLMRGESEIRMAQFSEDNFEGIAYEE